ncbi:aprataxin and PNK-like factor, partial [Austrofundulus limnaeus]|uniref:Aprataxin and PNK-like factor n=1 Tax=Austrofundulus limnaeus TaxID=52670 RepID=A0A2I4D6M1_AUSLI
MSGFDLVPVDGRDPIHLPPGETILGRGPLLDISDTRVSRHHGLLENLQGQLRLKPTHVNPCFIQSFPSQDPRPLEKDSWFLLHPGDLVSLLPGRFIYRVEAVGGATQTPRNSQNFQEEGEDGLPVSAEPDVGPEQKQTSPPSAAHSKTDSQDNLTRPVEESPSSVVLSEPRKRVLPAWMITAAPSSRLTAVKRRKQDTQTTPTPTTLTEEAELNEEEERRPKKKRRKMNKEEKQETETDDPAASSSQVSSSQVSSSQVSREPNASSQTSDGGEANRKSSDGGQA